jgi:hypothetical protein
MRATSAAVRKSRTTTRPANSSARATTEAGNLDLNARPERTETPARLPQRAEPNGVQPADRVPVSTGLLVRLAVRDAVTGRCGDRRPPTATGQSADHLRAMHRASLMHPGYCHEVCPAAQQLYAARVDAGWLAGVPTCRAS